MKAMLLGLGCWKLGYGGFLPALLCKMCPSFQGPFQLLLSGSPSDWLILQVLLYMVFKRELLPMQCWGWDGGAHLRCGITEMELASLRDMPRQSSFPPPDLRPTTVAGIAAPFHH